MELTTKKSPILVLGSEVPAGMIERESGLIVPKAASDAGLRVTPTKKGRHQGDKEKARRLRQLSRKERKDTRKTMD